MTRRHPVLALPLLTLAVLAAGAGAGAAGPDLTAAQAARAAAIQKNLRCPLCDTGESIEQSRADISVKMRQSVREQVAAGRADEDIYAFFAQRYGNVVLLDPPRRGRNLLLWGGPLLALLAGGGVWWTYLRRPGPAAHAAPEADPDPFDPFLAQVRRDTRPDGER